MINDALNYGYAILLSHVSREIAAAGYITQLGIWHTNEFNQFNLASDLMEPFRPIIDDYVISLGGIADFKQRMPALLLTQVIINGQNQFFEAAIKIFVRNVLKVMGETGRIEISEIEGYTLGEYEL